MEYLGSVDKKTNKNKEEGLFKEDINKLYKAIKDSNSRTLGEYLYKNVECKRNRIHAGGHLRTERSL